MSSIEVITTENTEMSKALRQHHLFHPQWVYIHNTTLGIEKDVKATATI